MALSAGSWRASSICSRMRRIRSTRVRLVDRRRQPGAGPPVAARRVGVGAEADRDRRSERRRRALRAARGTARSPPQTAARNPSLIEPPAALLAPLRSSSGTSSDQQPPAEATAAQERRRLDRRAADMIRPNDRAYAAASAERAPRTADEPVGQLRAAFCPPRAAPVSAPRAPARGRGGPASFGVKSSGSGAGGMSVRRRVAVGVERQLRQLLARRRRRRWRGSSS